MNFEALVNERYSCRKYDTAKVVEAEKLDKILELARLAPSACNGQPYHITVCRGQVKNKVAAATIGAGINTFAKDADIILVISEKPYVKTAAVASKLKKNDYRSMDIGILSAYISLAASELGLGSCILGWLNDEEIREACGISEAVRLCITLGYPAVNKIPVKKRLEIGELVDYKE